MLNVLKLNYKDPILIIVIVLFIIVTYKTITCMLMNRYNNKITSSIASVSRKRQEVSSIELIKELSHIYEQFIKADKYGGEFAYTHGGSDDSRTRELIHNVALLFREFFIKLETRLTSLRDLGYNIDELRHVSDVLENTYKNFSSNIASLETNVNDFEQRITTLLKDPYISNLSNELSSMNIERQELKTKIINTEQNIKNQLNNIEGASVTIETATNIKNEIYTFMNNLDNVINNNISDLSKRVLSLESTKSVSNYDTETLTREVTTFLELFDTNASKLINDKLTSIDYTISDVETKLIKLTRDIEKNTEDISNLIAEITNARGSESELKFRLDKINNMVQDLTQTSVITEEDVTFIKNELDAAKGNSLSLNSRIESIETLSTELDTTIPKSDKLKEMSDELSFAIGSEHVTLHGRLEAMDELIKSISTSKAIESSELEALSTEISLARGNQSSLGVVLNNLDSLYNTFKTTFDDLIEELKIVIGPEYDTLTSRLQSVEGTVSNTETNVFSLKKDFEDASGDFVSVSKRLDYINTGIDTINTELSSLSKPLKDKIFDIENDLKLIENEINLARGDGNVSLLNRFSILEKNISDLLNDISGAKGDQSSLNNVITKIQNDIKKLEQIYSDSSGEYHDTLSSRLNNLDLNITSLKSDIETTYSSIYNDNSTLNNLFTTMSSDVNLINTELTNAKTDSNGKTFETLDARLNDINSNIYVLDDEYKSVLNEDFPTLESKILDFNTRVIDMETELNDAAGTDENGNQISLNNRLGLLESDLQNKQDYINTKESELTNLVTNFNELNTDLEAISGQIISHDDHINLINNSLNSIDTKISNTSSKLINVDVDGNFTKVNIKQDVTDGSYINMPDHPKKWSIKNTENDGLMFTYENESGERVPIMDMNTSGINIENGSIHINDDVFIKDDVSGAEISIKSLFDELNKARGDHDSLGSRLEQAVKPLSNLTNDGHISNTAGIEYINPIDGTTSFPLLADRLQHISETGNILSSVKIEDPNTGIAKDVSAMLRQLNENGVFSSDLEFYNSDGTVFKLGTKTQYLDNFGNLTPDVSFIDSDGNVLLLSDILSMFNSDGTLSSTARFKTSNGTEITIEELESYMSLDGNLSGDIKIDNKSVSNILQNFDSFGNLSVDAKIGTMKINDALKYINDDGSLNENMIINDINTGTSVSLKSLVELFTGENTLGTNVKINGDDMTIAERLQRIENSIDSVDSDSLQTIIDQMSVSDDRLNIKRLSVEAPLVFSRFTSETIGELDLDTLPSGSMFTYAHTDTSVPRLIHKATDGKFHIYAPNVNVCYDEN